MSLSIKEDTENILGRKYNVEYKLGNDSIHTFSNVLTNIDGTYFWFSSLKDGLDVIRQDRIMTMTCLERDKNTFLNKNDKPSKAIFCESCGCQTDKNYSCSTKRIFCRDCSCME